MSINIAKKKFSTTKGPLLHIFRWSEKIATTPDVAMLFKVTCSARQGNHLDLKI